MDNSNDPDRLSGWEVQLTFHEGTEENRTLEVANLAEVEDLIASQNLATLIAANVVPCFYDAKPDDVA